MQGLDWKLYTFQIFFREQARIEAETQRKYEEEKRIKEHKRRDMLEKFNANEEENGRERRRQEEGRHEMTDKERVLIYREEGEVRKSYAKLSGRKCEEGSRTEEQVGSVGEGNE